MAAKSQMTGVVVAVERQVRHGLYGKTQRMTSKFLAHNEGNVARVGDQVEIFGTRPMSRRKRWTVSRIVRRALGMRLGAAGEAAEPGATGAKG